MGFGVNQVVFAVYNLGGGSWEHRREVVKSTGHDGKVRTRESGPCRYLAEDLFGQEAAALAEAVRRSLKQERRGK
jgi:hypothetical protein